MDPWGTPQAIVILSDSYLLIDRIVKYDLNQVNAFPEIPMHF